MRKLVSPTSAGFSSPATDLFNVQPSRRFVLAGLGASSAVAASGCDLGTAVSTGVQAFRVVASVIAFAANLIQVAEAAEAYIKETSPDDNSPLRNIRAGEFVFPAGETPKFEIHVENNTGALIECHFVDLELCDAEGRVIDTLKLPGAINIEASGGRLPVMQTFRHVFETGFNGFVSILQGNDFDGFGVRYAELRTVSDRAFAELTNIHSDLI